MAVKKIVTRRHVEQHDGERRKPAQRVELDKAAAVAPLAGYGLAQIA